jgi:hypothetical protein
VAGALDTQYAAANAVRFLQRVQMAIVLAAQNISNEAMTLGANLGSTAVTSIPLATALSAALPTGTVVLLSAGQGQREERFVSSGIAAAGAVAIPVTSQVPTQPHYAGDPVYPPTVSTHFVRSQLARLVLAAPATWAQLFAYAVAAQGVDDNSTDAAISTAVSSAWNALGGMP